VGAKKIKNKEWIYFCISEKVSKKPLSKCFYGLKQDFGDVKHGLVLNGIQYGCKERIYNSKGLNTFRKNEYFYPAFILRPQS